MKSSIPAFFAVVLIFAAGIVFGGVDMSWSEVIHSPVAQLRIVRMFAALFIGGALAISGMVFQAVLRNPLAEPFTLGISSGASVGAVLAFIFGLREVWYFSVPLAALLGGITVLCVVLWVSRGGVKGTESLLLSGIIAGTIASSILLYLLSNANNDELAAATWWMLGDLQSVDARLLIPAAVIILGALAGIRALAGEIDALALGDNEAFFLGAAGAGIRFVLILLASILAAVTVSLAGVIGFCGLIVPHIVRKLYCTTHRKIVFIVFWWGAGFLMLCDLLSRCIHPGRELPIGVVTSLIGGPIFLWILNRRHA